MKKVFRILLAAALIAALLIGSAFAATGKVVTTGEVNMRSGPGTGFIKIGAVPKGKTVSYKDSTSGWYYVGYNGAYGWISASYAKETGGQQRTGHVVLTEKANLRNSPNLNGSVIRTVSKGAELNYNGVATDDRGVDWYYVNYKGDYGWVSSTYAKPAQPSGSYVYATGNANVRYQPNLNADDFGTLHKGETAQYAGAMSTDGRGVVWYKIYFKNQIGWVSSKYSELNW